MKTILKKFREIYKRRELKDFKKTDAPKTWEVTESLDGFSQSLIWIEGMLCAKGYSADEINEEGASFLKDCQSAGMPATLKAHYPGRQLDLRGTLIGFGDS